MGDTETKLALPFKILENDSQIFDNLKKVVETDLVETFVIGRPISLSGGTSGETLEAVKNFSIKLKEKIELPIIFEDERLSSDMADSLMKLYGKKSDRDAIAAMIILQSYLDKIET